MSVDVEPRHLRGFAKQLVGDSTVIGSMGAYCSTNTDPAKLDGPLWLLQDLMGMYRDKMVEIMGVAEDRILRMSNELALTADRYCLTDAEGAEDLAESYVVVLDFGDDSGYTGDETIGASQIADDNQGVADGYSDGPDVELKEPEYDSFFIDWVRGALDDIFGGIIADQLGTAGQIAEVGADIAGDVVGIFDEEAGKAVSQTLSLSSNLNDLIKQFTDYDILGKLSTDVIGDSGRLRQLGKAWEQLEPAFTKLYEDLESGVTTLDGHWDSGPGGASEVFVDDLIRGRWAPCMDGLANLCWMLALQCEGMAMQYEHLIKTLVWLARFYVGKARKFLLALLGQHDGPSGGLSGLIDAIGELWDLILGVLEAIWDECMMFIQFLKTTYATIKQYVNILQGDFDVLK